MRTGPRKKITKFILVPIWINWQNARKLLSSLHLPVKKEHFTICHINLAVRKDGSLMRGVRNQVF